MSKISKFSALLLAGAMAIGANAANAATVSVSDTQIMTQNGQDFQIEFTGLSPVQTSGGTLTIANGISLTNPGPYDGLDIDSQGNSNEFFEVLVEGVSFGTYYCNTAGVHTYIPGCIRSVDTKFSLALDLTTEFLNSAISDGTFSVVIAFSTRVNHLNDRDQVITSLNFATQTVPVPISSILLGTALLSLGFCGHRRRVARKHLQL